MQDITSFHILILKLTGFQSALTLQNCKACEATKRANSPYKWSRTHHSEVAFNFVYRC